jgi:hypothetical protein
MGLPLGNMDFRSNTDTGWFVSDGMRFGTHRTWASICCFRLRLLRRRFIHLRDTIQDVDRQPVSNENTEGHEHFTLVFPVCYSRTRRFANEDETEVYSKTLSYSQSPPICYVVLSLKRDLLETRRYFPSHIRSVLSHYSRSFNSHQQD